MNRRYTVENVRGGVLLEARIKKGARLIKQESLVKGAVAKGSVPAGASLQVREKSLRTGKATPWETIIKAAPAPKKKPKKSKKKPAKKKAKKSTPKKRKKSKKKNPRKKKLPPAEWFYYRAAQLKKAGRVEDPNAVAASQYWKMKAATKKRIGKLVTAERAKGRGTVVTSRGKLTRKAVTGNVGKKAAAGIYKKVRPTKAEIAAAKKAAKKNPCPPKRKA